MAQISKFKCLFRAYSLLICSFPFQEEDDVYILSEHIPEDAYGFESALNAPSGRIPGFEDIRIPHPQTEVYTDTSTD